MDRPKSVVKGHQQSSGARRALQPPRATRDQPEFVQFFPINTFWSFFFGLRRLEIVVLARRLLKPSRFVGIILESKYWRSWRETSRQAKG